MLTVNELYNWLGECIKNGNGEGFIVISRTKEQNLRYDGNNIDSFTMPIRAADEHVIDGKLYFELIP